MKICAPFFFISQSGIKPFAGALVFDKTEINDIFTHSRSVELITSENLKVKATFAVMATGYESVKWIDKTIAKLHQHCEEKRFRDSI